MKNFLFCSLFVCLVLSACSTEKAPETVISDSSSTVQVVDLAPAEFASQSKGGILVDVRTPAEIAQGAIAGSIAMDFSQDDFQAQLTQLPKDRAIYLYCAVGGRSSKASDLLVQHGFTKVYNLQGGMTAWNEAGLPVTIAQ